MLSLRLWAAVVVFSVGLLWANPGWCAAEESGGHDLVWDAVMRTASDVKAEEDLEVSLLDAVEEKIEEAGMAGAEAPSRRELVRRFYAQQQGLDTDETNIRVLRRYRTESELSFAVGLAGGDDDATDASSAATDASEFIILHEPTSPAELDRQLYLTAYHGHTDEVRRLINSGAHINNALDDQSGSPLYAACFNNHYDIAQLLLESGAIPDAALQDGATPLYAAAQHGQIEMTALLLDHGADPNMARENGWTALQIAAQHGHTGILRLLIERGASIDTQNRGGITAVITAAVHLHTDTLRLLLESGADPNLASANGLSALDFLDGQLLDLAEGEEMHARGAETRRLLVAHGAQHGPGAVSTFSFTFLAKTTLFPLLVLSFLVYACTMFEEEEGGEGAEASGSDGGGTAAAASRLAAARGAHSATRRSGRGRRRRGRRR